MRVRAARSAILIICLPAFPCLIWASVNSGAARKIPAFAFALAISFTACALITPLVKRLAVALDIVDSPGGRKIHKRTTPLLGGVAVFASLLIPIVLLRGFSSVTIPILAGAFIMLIAGVIDDASGNLPAKVRIALQTAAAAIVIYYGGFFKFLPGAAGFALGAAVTLLWIVGVTNAVNFLDGMDGLASGLCAAASGGMAVIAYLSGMGALALLSASICGACLGFIVHNFNPADIFLGDAGSTTLGFLLASIGASGKWAPGNPLHSFIVPVIAMMIPVFDMTFTTIDRFGTGKVHTIFEWLVYTGRDHFHHRVSGLGLSTRGSVLVIYAIGAALAATAFLAAKASFASALLCLATVIIFFIALSFYMISFEKKAAQK